MAARPHDRGRPRARNGEGSAPSARRICLSAAASLVALTFAFPALADDAQEVELGKNRFDAGQYAEAAKRFTTMLDPAVPPCDKDAPKKSGRCRITDKELIEQARAFAAASLVALGRVPDADVHIEKLLRANPAYSPNPALFPAEVIDRFTEVKGRIRAELETIARKEAEEVAAKQAALKKAQDAEKAWLDELQRLASKERIIERNSRLVAFVPFGVGQIQNGDKGLGILFAVSEAITGIASIALSSATYYWESIDPNTINPDTGKKAGSDTRKAINATTQTIAMANQITFGAWAALTIAGVVQAQIAFVPERVTYVDRPLPKRPPPVVMPAISFTPGGSLVGVTGRF